MTDKNDNYRTACVVLGKEVISYSVRDCLGIVYSGSDSLVGVNGCYDSLLSNVLTRLAKYRPDEYLVRKD